MTRHKRSKEITTLTGRARVQFYTIVYIWDDDTNQSGCDFYSGETPEAAVAELRTKLGEGSIQVVAVFRGRQKDISTPGKSRDFDEGLTEDVDDRGDEDGEDG